MDGHQRDSASPLFAALLATIVTVHVHQQSVTLLRAHRSVPPGAVVLCCKRIYNTEIH